MTLLFIGDIFARPGREIVKRLLPRLREERRVDVVIANGENARHGNGLDRTIYDELRGAGIDWFTGGDHSFSNKEFFPVMDDPASRVLRPANYPKGAPGRGMMVSDELTIINLQGRVFMRPLTDNPFAIINQLLEDARGFVLVDFHAEATSEKNTLGHYLDGRIGAMVGTHTHVQTADERLLPKGTAYITDVGMTGPMDGSVGGDLSLVTPSFTMGLPFKLEPAPGPAQLNAVLIRTEGTRAISIERIVAQE